MVRAIFWVRQRLFSTSVASWIDAISLLINGVTQADSDIGACHGEDRLILNWFDASHTVSWSNASGTAEADDHVRSVDDHGNDSFALRMNQHLIERSAIHLDVLVLDSDVSTGVILTGRQGVRSGIFAEDEDFVLQRAALS